MTQTRAILLAWLHLDERTYAPTREELDDLWVCADAETREIVWVNGDVHRRWAPHGGSVCVMVWLAHCVASGPLEHRGAGFELLRVTWVGLHRALSSTAPRLPWYRERYKRRALIASSSRWVVSERDKDRYWCAPVVTTALEAMLWDRKRSFKMRRRGVTYIDSQGDEVTMTTTDGAEWVIFGDDRNA